MRLVLTVLLMAAFGGAGAARASTCASGFHAEPGGRCAPTLPCPGGFTSGPNNRCAPVAHCAPGAIALANGRCALSQCPDGFTPSAAGCAVIKRCAHGGAPTVEARCPTIDKAPRPF
jgi:hypothetical protein